MKRFIVCLATLTILIAAADCRADDTFPPPKAAWPPPAIDEGRDHVGENKNCNFLCDIYLLNCTGTKVKVWVRATLLCFPPGFVVDVPAECDGRLLTAHPCCHPWSIWFDEIRIGVWDGETCETIGVKFKNECCKRRYVIEYDNHHKIRIVEK